MNQSSFSPTIDEYLRKRLMPVEGAIQQLAGLDMYGNSIPAGTVGGDLFEYINFQQRYNIDGRIARVLEYRAEWSVPWLSPDPEARVDQMSVEELIEALEALPAGVVARQRISVFYPVQVPDLIGVKDRKYLDHTGL